MKRTIRNRLARSEAVPSASAQIVKAPKNHHEVGRSTKTRKHSGNTTASEAVSIAYHPHDLTGDISSGMPGSFRTTKGNISTADYFTTKKIKQISHLLGAVSPAVLML